MKRKHSPLHDKWHRRVEGQIRDTIHAHPKWFSFKNEGDKQDCINSLAKRIVGEIVAAAKVETIQDNMVARCVIPGRGECGSTVCSSGKDMGRACILTSTNEEKVNG